MAEKAIGRDIAPPDLHAKITGRAKYAEDFRAEGMLFAKLLLSPMPHARVRSVNARAALAMEGVVAVLRADDEMMPEINGVAAEAALTNEPLYEGEAVLAVAAETETIAAAAIEAIRVDFEPLPFVVDPLDSLRPGGPNARLDGNIQWREGQTREIREFKWTNADFEAAGPDRLPMGEPQVEWNIGDVEASFGDADLILEETILHQSLSHHPMESGSQTTHAHTRSNHAAALDMKRKLQQIAAMDLGGSPDSYDCGDGRVFSRSNGGRGMTFAQAAQRAIELGGEYDGHTLPDDINAMTTRSATNLAGEGLIGVARDNYGGDGGIWSWVIGFAQVEVDVETGQIDLTEYTAVTDCGTVLHPRSLGAQLHGGGVQGFGQARSQKWVFDPQWGVAFAKRLYTARPPGILDVPLEMKWAAVDLPDPQTPVGAKGIGEPPIGAGAAAVASAVADALGGQCLCRTPLTTDVVLAALTGTEQPYRPLETHV